MRKQISIAHKDKIFTGYVQVDTKGVDLLNHWSQMNPVHTIYYSVSASVIFEEDGEPVSVFGYHTQNVDEIADLAERAEDAVRKAIREYTLQVKGMAAVIDKLKNLGYEHDDRSDQVGGGSEEIL